MIVREANILCPAENFYCAGIVNLTTLARRKPSANFEMPYLSPTMHRRRELQTAAEKLSHNIIKRWRTDETRARIASAYRAVPST